VVISEVKTFADNSYSVRLALEMNRCSMSMKFEVTVNMNVL